MRRTIAIALATFATALLSSTARADDAPAPPPPASAAPPAPAPTPPPRDEPPEVRVIGNKADSLQKTAGSGTLISTKEIERADPYDAAEMLRRVPGINVRQEEEGNGRLDIGIRGLDPGRSRRVLVLEDGIPIAVNPYAEPDLIYSPPIERMRGIEVVKGSGSILFGPQTVGGVVNFFTLMPPSRPHAGFELDYGNYNYSKLLASYGDSVGQNNGDGRGARYVVQAMQRHGDGARGLPFNMIDVFGKLAFDTGEHGEAIIKVGFNDNRAYAPDVGLTRGMFEQDPRRAAIAPYDLTKERRYEVSLTQVQRFSENTKLTTLAYAYVTTRFWRRQDYSRSFDPSATYERIVGDEQLPNGAIYFRDTDTVLDRTYQVAALEPRFEHRFETGGVGHTLDLGGRFLTETAHYEQRAGNQPFAEIGQIQNAERHLSFAEAAYLQDRMQFREWLLVTPGVRFEHVDYQRHQLTQTSGTSVQDVDILGNRAVSAVIPGIGIIAGKRDAHAFAGMHLGFAPPRLTDTISPKGVNVPLDAEFSTNWELGARVYHRKWLRAEATLFESEFTNQIVASSTGAELGGTVLVNGGHTRHYGAEGAVMAELGKKLKLPLMVDLGARGFWSHASFVGGQYAGNYLPYAPLYSFTGTLDLDKTIGASALGGEIAWTHVASEYVDSVNTRDEDATGRAGLVPAYDILDLSARFRHPRSGITVKLNVKNALDNVYISQRRPEGIQTAGFRQIMLGVRWDWEKRETPQ